MAEEETNPVSDQNPESSGAPEDSNHEKTSEDVEALKQELESLRKHNKELLGEKKKVKSKLSELETEKEKAERQSLEEQGRYKEMYEKIKGDYDSLQSELTNAVKSRTFREIAQKEGAKPELIDVLERTADLSDIDIDGFKPDSKAIEFEVQKLKDKYGKHFFGKDKPAIADGNPSTKEPEKSDVVTEAKNAKTQKEFDEIMKKHGFI